MRAMANFSMPASLKIDPWLLAAVIAVWAALAITSWARLTKRDGRVTLWTLWSLLAVATGWMMGRLLWLALFALFHAA